MLQSAAIPETVGSAGIVLNEREPALMAEAASLVVNESYEVGSV